MSPEEYENQISLLKEALKFYADKKNYRDYPEGIPLDGKQFPPIEIDKGHQARFALEQLNVVEVANKKLKDDYDKIIGDTIKAIENHPFDLTDAIKNLKDLDND